jgi:DNA-binding CsgD family transcriptional regulator
LACIEVIFLAGTNMAVAGVFRAKRESTRNTPAYTCEELIRQLVSQIITLNRSNSPNPQQKDFASHEEVLLDVDLDGAQYLLVRLPKENRQQVRLSAREQEIVRMVAKGFVNKMIADVLNISPWTVCTHLRRIFAKLGVGSRAAMVAKVLGESSSWGPSSSGEKIAAGMNTLERPHPLPRTGLAEKAAPAGVRFPSRSVG